MAPPARTLVGPALVALLLVLAGCASVVPGRLQAQRTPGNVSDAQVHIVGATDGPVDEQTRDALADLQTFWTEQFPSVFDKRFTPLQGGYFSVDPNNIDPATYPQGVGCGTDPKDVENNAFYCRAPNTAHSDSISYDRTFLGELAGKYGQFLPDLVMAHEFGHAVQARVGGPDASIAVETQADCYAGAWTKWVADGKAAHTSLQQSALDQLLLGYLQLRDPIGTSPGAQQAHGSGFDRVSAFQEGFDSGATACRDDFGPDRVFTQSQFTSDADFANQGNAPYDQLQDLMSTGFPEFWQKQFPATFGKQFTAPKLEPFSSKPPAGCGNQDLELVYCAKGPLVGYDEPDLTKPAYDIGDYAVVTAVAIPYGLDVRDQLGRSAHDSAAYRSSVCLAGWFSAAVSAGQLTTVQISPGDLDESVQFLLKYGQDPKVLPGVDESGFQLVDTFRKGFLQGAPACDVGA
jgi:predicted metalloprotease